MKISFKILFIFIVVPNFELFRYNIKTITLRTVRKFELNSYIILLI